MTTCTNCKSEWVAHGERYHFVVSTKSTTLALNAKSKYFCSDLCLVRYFAAQIQPETIIERESA